MKNPTPAKGCHFTGNAEYFLGSQKCRKKGHGTNFLRQKREFQGSQKCRKEGPKKKGGAGPAAPPL
jgi:hypothetical protein